MPRHDQDNFDDFEDDEDFMTFDARDNDEGMSRGPIILAAVVLLLAVFLAMFWVYYNGNKTKSTETPILSAQSEDYKEVPINAAGALGEDLDKNVYNSLDGSSPPPLQIESMGNNVEDPLLSANQVAAPISANTPKPVVKDQTTATKPVAKVETAPKPVVKTETTPKPVAKVETTPKPVVKAETTPKPVVKEESAPKPTGKASAQLGSFPTKEQAQKAIDQYRAKGLTGPVSIVSADLGAKGTWYRVKATGFESRDQALSFCAKAKGAGANCIPSN